MASVASKCCRSSPRCAGCPVLMARRRKHESQTQRLVADILLGTQRSLPRGVTEQLDLLAVARRRRVASA